VASFDEVDKLVNNDVLQALFRLLFQLGIESDSAGNRVAATRLVFIRLTETPITLTWSLDSQVSISGRTSAFDSCPYHFETTFSLIASSAPSRMNRLSLPACSSTFWAVSCSITLSR
jgi:hypothetical protein